MFRVRYYLVDHKTRERTPHDVGPFETRANAEAAAVRLSGQDWRGAYLDGVDIEAVANGSGREVS